MNERIKYASCPLCERPNIFPHKTGNCSAHALYNPVLSPTINWCKCLDCGHIFTEGYYTDEACGILFGKTHDNQRAGVGIEHNRLISSRMIEKVLPYAAEGRWLDVGFGNCSLLFTAQEYGFRPVGTDLRVDNVRIAQGFGIEAYSQDITDLALHDKCAVVSMADVLEHIPFPKPSLTAAHALLEPGGILFISMPNLENIFWDDLDKHGVNPYWGEIEHYHNFSRTRLYALLKECGFTPLRYGISERYRVCMEVIAQKT
jgi:SAM-dependent methyltransferase